MGDSIPPARLGSLVRQTDSWVESIARALIIADGGGGLTGEFGWLAYRLSCFQLALMSAWLWSRNYPHWPMFAYGQDTPFSFQRSAQIKAC